MRSARTIGCRENNVRYGEDTAARPVKYIFGVDRTSNTPYITTAYHEDVATDSIKVKPKPSRLFGYVDID
ncbi:MAG: hypothetical protein R6T78_00945 [Dehalococcoidales bacterium]